MHGFDYVYEFAEACEASGYEIQEDWQVVWYEANALIYGELMGQYFDIDEAVELLDGTFFPREYASALDYGDGYIPRLGCHALSNHFDWWSWLDNNNVGLSCCGETYAFDGYIVCDDCGHVMSEYYVRYDEHSGEYYCDGCYSSHCCGDRSRVHPYHTFNSQCEKLGTCAGFPPVFSLWHVGFEVEKTDINGSDSEGDEVPETTLFAGVETDGSCGVEAISHIIPLHDDCLDNLVSLAKEASEILDAPTSNKCGGHINLSRAGGIDINRLRPYLAPFYALYKRRLGNGYCSGNKSIDEKAPREKYSVINLKSGGVVEFRLPSAVTSSKAFIFRYRAMIKMANAYESNMDAVEFIDSITPLVAEVYGADKLEQWQYDSLAFLDYLTTGSIDASIRQYI